MRSARGLAMWAAAAWVALTVLVRIARGEVVILSGYAAPVVRLVAIVLVFLASCADRLRPGESGDLSEGAGSQGQAGDLSAGSGSQGQAGDLSAGSGSQGQAGDLAQGTGPQGAGSGASAPPTVEPVLAAPQAFPDSLTDAALSAMVAPRGEWRRMAQGTGGAVTVADLDLAPDRVLAAQRLTSEFAAFHARRAKGEAETAATLRGLLAAIEGVPLFEAWLAGLLWQHARTIRPAPVDVYARLEWHLRVAHAVVRAQVTVGRIEFTAWRSKAGPPPGWRGVTVPPGLAKEARREFNNGVDAGTWESGSVLPLKVGPGSVVLIRRGQETTVAAGQAVRLRRLDVIRTADGATLEHATLGSLVLPRGAELTAWNAGEYLAADARARMQRLVDEALTGGAPDGLTKLEGILPAAHAAIRAAVAARPDAPGAAGLRTLLVMFDE